MKMVNLLIRLIVFTAVTTLGFSASAAPGLTCNSMFWDWPLDFTVEQANYKGLDYEFTKYPKRNHYDLRIETPNLQNSLLIHFNERGHVTIFYRENKIDAGGAPGFVYNVPDKGRAAQDGVVFAIHKLPENFNENFENFIRLFETKQSITCVSSACDSLQKLGFGEDVPKKFVSALNFYEHLIKVSTESNGRIEVVSFGKDMDQFPTALAENQKIYIKYAAQRGLMMGAGFSAFFGFFGYLFTLN